MQSMKHISFHPQEQILHAPAGQEDKIEPLQIVALQYEDGSNAIVSCWQPSLKDLLTIVLQRKIYLAVLDWSHPPVMITTNLRETGMPMSNCGSLGGFIHIYPDTEYIQGYNCWFCFQFQTTAVCIGKRQGRALFKLEMLTPRTKFRIS